MTTLGEFLRQRRKELGLVGREVAAAVGKADGTPISTAYLVDLEHDHRKPSDSVLNQLATVLQVDADVLFFLEGRRKQLRIFQKELADRLRNQDGAALSASYLNYLEHVRGEPLDYLLEQIATILDLPVVALYFWVGRLPPDLVPTEYVETDRIAAAFNRFRVALRNERPRTSAEEIR